MDDSKSPFDEEGVNEYLHGKIGNAIEVMPMLPTLLNEAPLLLYPKLAVKLGVKPGLFLSQVMYWLKDTPHKHKGERVVRFSYSRWREQLPFVSRQTVIQIVSRLEKRGAIKVIRTKRVNLIAIGHAKFQKSKPQAFDSHEAHITVFGTLAKELGLGPAVCLQQVHVRHHWNGSDPNYYVKKSYERWQRDCLMFWSVRQIKRYFDVLMAKGLVRVKKLPGVGGVTNGYQVDYQALRSLMAGKTTLAPVIDLNMSHPVAKKAIENGEYFHNFTNIEEGWVGVVYSKTPTLQKLMGDQ